MVATSSRRKIIAAVLLILAISGGFIRYFAPNPSTLRDIGSLLLVLWVPAIGNIIGFFGRKIPLPAPKLAFDADTPFIPEIVIEFNALAQQPPRPAVPEVTEGLFTLVVGRNGFNARAANVSDDYLASAQAQQIALQFLRPAHALDNFPEGTAFKVLVGSRAVGRGIVLQRSAP